MCEKPLLERRKTQDAARLAAANVDKRREALYQQDYKQALGAAAKFSGELDKQNKSDGPSERIRHAELRVEKREIDKYRQDYRQATFRASNSELQAQEEL